MALDMDRDLRTNRRIDELKDWVDQRFDKIEERRRSAQLRMVGVLTFAVYMVLFYILWRTSEVSHPGVACESAHPTTDASHP